MTNTKLNEALRNEYLNLIKDHFISGDYEVLRTGSNEIALPCVDSEGNEKFIIVTVKVPTGSREDKEPYDGYSVAEAYAMKCKEKAQKAKAAADKKAKKIKADEKRREEAKGE